MTDLPQVMLVFDKRLNEAEFANLYERVNAAIQGIIKTPIAVVEEPSTTWHWIGGKLKSFHVSAKVRNMHKFKPARNSFITSDL